MTPLVSIVITSYNRKEKALRSITSALEQTEKKIEVICVDDGSSDGTPDFLKQSINDDRFTLITLTQNVGPGGARNKGLEMVKGEWFIVWDSDDILYPHAISTLLAKAKDTPDLVTVSATTTVFRTSNDSFIPHIPEGSLSMETIICAKMPKYKMVRMSKTKEAGMIRYMARNIDFMFNTYLRERGPWFHIDEALGDHFLLSDTTSLTVQRRKKNINRSIERAPFLDSYLEHFGSVLINTCRERYADHAYGAAVGFLLAGRYDKSRFYAKQASVFGVHKKYSLFYMLTLIPGSSHLLRLLFRF